MLQPRFPLACLTIRSRLRNGSASGRKGPTPRKDEHTGNNTVTNAIPRIVYRKCVAREPFSSKVTYSHKQMTLAPARLSRSQSRHPTGRRELYSKYYTVQVLYCDRYNMKLPRGRLNWARKSLRARAARRAARPRRAGGRRLLRRQCGHWLQRATTPTLARGWFGARTG